MQNTIIISTLLRVFLPAIAGAAGAYVASEWADLFNAFCSQGA